MKAAALLNPVLIERATQLRDEARQALARAQHEQAHAQQQMLQLKNYSGETVQRWGMKTAHTTNTLQLQTQQTFLGKLDVAIHFQNDVLERHAHNVQRCQSQLIEAERALTTLQKVQQRRMQTQQRRLQRQEQQATDELAANQYRRLQTSLESWSVQP